MENNIKNNKYDYKMMINERKKQKCGKFASDKIGSYNEVNNGAMQWYGTVIHSEWKAHYGDMMVEIMDGDGERNHVVMRGLELVEIVCDSGHGVRQRTLGTHGEMCYMRPEEKNVLIKVRGLWLRNDGWRCVEYAFFRSLVKRCRISSRDSMTLLGDFVVSDYSVGNRDGGFAHGRFSLRSSGAVGYS